MSVDVAIMIVGACASIIAAVSSCICVVLIEDILRRCQRGQLIEPDSEYPEFLEVPGSRYESAAVDRLKAR